jgi:hypothetical protein
MWVAEVVWYNDVCFSGLSVYCMCIQIPRVLLEFCDSFLW